MISLPLGLTAVGLLFSQVYAFRFGGCARDCIDDLDTLGDSNCTNGRRGDDWGWSCICNDRDVLEAVNGCITSCTDLNQTELFANIAQGCANKGSPITDVPAQATFSATSGGTYGSWNTQYDDDGDDGSSPVRGNGRGGRRGGGRKGNCTYTTFTGDVEGWGVSWESALGANCTADSASGSGAGSMTESSPASASVSAAANSQSLSVGATVVTTVSGETLTGTVFRASGATATPTSTAAQQNTADKSVSFGSTGALLIAVFALFCVF